MTIKIPKEEWGDGPWLNEPDKDIWIDPETDFPCLLWRHGGTWCGYVGVPPDHPANGLSYYQSSYELEEVESGKAAEMLPAQKQVNDIHVHGGLTFSGSRDWLFPADARCRNWHFFGFDCNHAGDIDPQMNAYWLRAGHPEWVNEPGSAFIGDERYEYCDYEYAKAQCTKLAKQLHAIWQ